MQLLVSALNIINMKEVSDDDLVTHACIGVCVRNGNSAVAT